MKKLLVLLSFALCLSFTTDTQYTVYICNSKNATAYHLDKNCFALRRCTYEVYAVSRTDAINKYGRKLCGHED